MLFLNNFLRSKRLLLLFFFFEKFMFLQHLMIESLSLEEEKITKDIRNLFRLQK